MKYKGMNENTIRRMLQSNETALLQKGVTDMLNTITNTTDSLLSSFSIEKFFSNKKFSDLSAFVKDILKQVEDMGNKASTANINNIALEKSITDFMKQINVNTKKTSESVNRIVLYEKAEKPSNLNEDIKNSKDLIFNPIQSLINTMDILDTDLSEYSKNLYESGKENLEKTFKPLTETLKKFESKGIMSSNDPLNIPRPVAILKGVIETAKESMKTGSIVDFFDKGIENFNKTVDKITDVKNYDINISKIFKSNTDFLKSILSGTMNLFTGKKSDYTEEQSKDEEKQRSITQNQLAERQLGWLQGSLMPWLKKFGEEQRLESDGFIATFFPMLASMINASPLLLKLIGFAKMFLTIGGAIFGAVKFVEGIQKAVDVLGHEIDFTSLHGWLEALNLGIGNIVSSITGIDLKTVYKWLDNFDRTLANAYKRYLAPIFNSIWKSVKETVISAYNAILQPIINKVDNFFTEFSGKFPEIVQLFKDVKDFIVTGMWPVLRNMFTDIMSGIGKAFKPVVSLISNDDTDWGDFLATLMSPIETISTGVTEIMKYVVTFYEMLTKSSGVGEFFDPDKWKKTYEEVGKSSYFTGNRYADEINRLNEASENYLKRIGEEWIPKRKKYEQMSLSDFGISSETYSNYRDIWNNIIKEKLSKEDSEALDRILKNYELTAELSTPQKYARDKQIMEDFKRLQLSGIEANISGYKKYIEENDRKVKELKKQNEQEKFIEAQMRSKGISRDEAYKLWSRMQSRQKENSIESVKDKDKVIDAQNEMSANQQAEMKADETKPAQPTINANGSGNVINNYNNNVTTSNIQSDVKEQQMMKSAENTAN